jgi:hypothetical protein
MTRHSLERRLAALESARSPDTGMYWVDIGEPDVDDSERMQLDAWPRPYSGVVVDIGASVECQADGTPHEL